MDGPLVLPGLHQTASDADRTVFGLSMDGPLVLPEVHQTASDADRTVPMAFIDGLLMLLGVRRSGIHDEHVVLARRVAGP